MLYLAILVWFVFFAGIAMTVGEGLWNNSVTLLAIILSSVLGAVFGPPVGALLLEQFGKTPDMMWYFAFAGTWLTFFVSVLLFRLLTERASRTRVRFVPPLELAGGPIVGVFAAVMFTSFLAFTLYSMPMRAGEWDFSKGSSWQQTTFKQGSGPFFAVLKGTLGEEAAMNLFKQ